ncbi:MAG: phosphoribosylamine--glycine ligase [Gammaproteobacteria bacterium]|nr:phosphoribosylamine--glycine ligase [Gammaproteobacteria bacterium]
MHVLLIGSGGREHAMAWKLAESSAVSKVSVAPGNVGMAAEPKVDCVPIAVDDFDHLIEFVKSQQVTFTVVGPEVPLVAGIVDEFNAADCAILGPTAAAAQLEGSKGYAKAFMDRHGIPTASYERFHDASKALEYVQKIGAPIVIKADGLAAGKGVVVASTLNEAQDAVTSMLADNVFGDAGSSVVIEQFLSGEEASFIALVDGATAQPFATSQDHKARNEGDTGPNTGGMGAYSPAPVVTPEIEKHIVQDILEPTVAGLIKDKTPFKGFLYIGLMIDSFGNARVIEYNVRLGDPETQPLMLRLDSDFAALCLAAINEELHQSKINWSKEPALGVVVAAGEYPQSSSKGEPITGLEEAAKGPCKVFHAGTRSEKDTIVTNGGRVLCVTAKGQDIAQAKSRADEGATKISWKGARFRRDIGHRALARLADTEPA